MHTNTLAHAHAPSLRWIDPLFTGEAVLIRPLTPEDIARERAFLARLSPEYRSYRFLGLIKGTEESVLRELTQVDPTRETVLVAIARRDDEDIEVGVARYRIGTKPEHCDCAVTVDPAWQRRGVGRLLMCHLIDVARTQGIRRMYAVDAARSAGAHRLAEQLGFRSCPDPEDPAATTFELELV